MGLVRDVRGVTGNANIMPVSVNSYLISVYMDMSIALRTDAARTSLAPVSS